MSLDSTLEDQQRLADTFARAGSRMSHRELLSEALAGGSFLVVAIVLLLASPHQPFKPLPVALSALVLIAATLVRIDTPFGFTVPIQLAFVPLLFAAPLGAVPLIVAASLAIARLPDVLSGKVRPSRLLQTVANAWFAIGPVAVFTIADTLPQEAGPALLIAALAAQFAVDFVVSTARFSLARSADLASQLRETWVYVVDAALTGVGLVVAEAIHSAPAAPLALVPLLAVMAMFAHERHARLENVLELNNAYRGTALVLGDVVDADDGYTGEHCRGVVELALAVADELRLSPVQRRNLEFGALLHDVGKIAIPKKIVNKPGGLDPAEWETMKTHTVEGQRMLEQVGGFMVEVGKIVRAHHERWDGTGYPDGLVGEAIPLESRIISCCDTWNAMRTDRAYRKALRYDVALAELNSHVGSQFDPRAVAALMAVLERDDAPVSALGPDRELVSLVAPFQRAHDEHGRLARIHRGGRVVLSGPERRMTS